MSTGLSPTSGFRSLADQLRAWSDAQLGTLLGARPDLASPAPQDLAQLASRASTRASSARALDQLTHFQLAIVGAIMTTQPVPPESLTARGPAVEAAVAHLCNQALVWHSVNGLRVVSGVAEALPTNGFPTSTSPVAPVPPCVEREGSLVHRTAAGAAFETLGRVEALLEAWSHHPVAGLRGGGLGIRDLRSLATKLQVDEAHAALLAEVVVASSLATSMAGPDGGPIWVPTDAYDLWRETPPAQQWLTLFRAWLAMPRTPALVGGRDSAGRPVNALTPDLVHMEIAETRAMALRALGDLGAGKALAGGTGIPGLITALEWQRPRRSRQRAEHVVSALSEAAHLGAIGFDALASYTAAFLAGDLSEGLELLGVLLPAPLDHILVQADLTAVAPGPLLPAIARDLTLVAAIESRGGATVYRFSADSLRAAFDAGWSAADIHEFVGRVSRTPVPQPLTYLIDDVARTYGAVRVGHADAFLRSDDVEALTELLSHPATDGLGLRRIAPTVLISSTPLDVLLARLREAGIAPVVEAPDGTVHVARPDAHRARTPKEHRLASAAKAREVAATASVVAALRAGDAAAASRPHREAGLTPADALAALRASIDAEEQIVISYVDNHGTMTERVVDPQQISEGTLTAVDQRSGQMRTFAVHRIRDVRAL